MLKVNRKKLPLAVLQALGAGAMVGVVAPVANAQVQPTQTTPTTTVTAEEVQKFSTTVTGSRIPSANLTSTSPVTTVGAQDIKIEGVQNVENLLNNLPQVFADFGANESNGATGTAYGQPPRPRRAAHPGADQRPSYAGGQPDLLPDRPERDSRAADRAGGNPDRRRIGGLRLRRGRGRGELHHEGQFPGPADRRQLERATTTNRTIGLASVIAARAATNPAQFRGAGQCRLTTASSSNINITMGSNFAGNRGNATLFFQYSKTQPVSQKNRDYSACATADSADGLSLVCGARAPASPANSWIWHGGWCVHDRRCAGRRAAVSSPPPTSSTSPRTTTTSVRTSATASTRSPTTTSTTMRASTASSAFTTTTPTR